MASERDPLQALLLYGQPADEQMIGGQLTANVGESSTPVAFFYAATPNPVPSTDDPARPSTVTLMIAVANTSGEDQDCS